MSSNETRDSPLELTIGPNRTKTFRSVEGVSVWLDQEKETFTWLINLGGSLTRRENTAKGDLKTYYVQIANAIDRFKNANDNQISNARQSLESKFESLYGREKIIASNSPKAAYLEKLRQEKGDRFAAKLYAHLTRIVDDDHVKEMRASFYAHIFEQGLTDTEQAESESLAHLKSDWEKRYETLRTEELKRFNKLVDKAQGEQKKLADKYGNQLNTLNGRATDLEEIIDGAKTQLQETTEHYRDQIALLEPVQYWKDKAWWHLAGAVAWGLVTVTAFILVGYFFLGQVEQVLGTGGDPDYAQLIVLLTLATLGIWGLRLLVRLFFSQIHLRADAKERSVMLQSFLAMLREGHVGEDEKDAVLSTLFRPARSGVVKDDSAPPNVAEVISRLGSR